MSAAFLFDVDGTLIDSVDLHARAWQEALAHFGFETGYAQVRGQIGKGGDQLLPVFVPADRLGQIGGEIDRYRAELFSRVYLPQVRPFPRVRELFLRIRRDGHRIALASSAKADELEKYKKLLDIDDLIAAETSSGDVESSKPCPDVFEAALERVDVEPDDAVVIGDTPYDAIAARRAGLRTVGVLCGGFPEKDLRDEGCVKIYEDPADLLERYGELDELVRRGPQTPGSPYGRGPSLPA
jgi:HAD superfamily hydrolase (TIGR01509 family)